MTTDDALDAGHAFRATFRAMVSGAPARFRLITLLEHPGQTDQPDRVQEAADALRDAVAELLARGQHAAQIHTGATVDEVYVLIRALGNAPGDRAAVARAVDLVLDGLSPRYPRYPEPARDRPASSEPDQITTGAAGTRRWTTSGLPGPPQPAPGNP